MVHIKAERADILDSNEAEQNKWFSLYILYVLQKIVCRKNAHNQCIYYQK